MAAMAVTLLASANPFFHYKEWKTPHGTYPFNDIKPEHYMPAFEEGIKQGGRLIILSETAGFLPEFEGIQALGIPFVEDVSCSVGSFRNQIGRAHV